MYLRRSTQKGVTDCSKATASVVLIPHCSSLIDSRAPLDFGTAGREVCVTRFAASFVVFHCR